MMNYYNIIFHIVLDILKFSIFNIMPLIIQYHAETIKNVREATESFGNGSVDYRPIAIALDTKGPEIRTGLIKGVSSCQIATTRHFLVYYRTILSTNNYLKVFLSSKINTFSPGVV